MQLGFGFVGNDNYYLDDFITFKGNQIAFDFVNAIIPNALNNNIFLITGPKKSGKTYLTKIWEQKTKAIPLDIKKMNEVENLKIFYRALVSFIRPGHNYILEDLERLNLEEEKLFHLFNIINEKSAKLLMTSKKLVSEFSFELKDLQSRFINIINFRINYLDTDAKKLFITKLFADRQLRVEDKVIDYLVKNTNNIYLDLYNKINKIYEVFSQNKNRKISISLIKRLI